MSVLQWMNYFIKRGISILWNIPQQYRAVNCCTNDNYESPKGFTEGKQLITGDYV